MTTLTFYGAAQQVTGSCYLIDTGKHRLLLECGMQQGQDKKKNRKNKEHELPFELDPAGIDAVVLSHNHLDHCGLVPLLTRQGYKGPIFCTKATRDLLPIMYRDAASLMLSDMERKNRRLMRSGKRLLEPAYTLEDVEQALTQVVGLDYRKKEQLLPGFTVQFRDAGHVLGSSIVELWINDGQSERKLVFSGDLGNSESPLMKDPEIIDEADILLMESTYGDRNHRSLDETMEEFRDVIKTVSQAGGNVLIPAFAVGRTQDLIYWFGQLYRDGLLKQKVYIDSPMAIKVSNVYEQYDELFNHDNPDFTRFIKQGWDEWLPGLTYTESPEQSMALNRISDGAIIIAGSGMCTGGRIVHHLKHNLWRDKNHVVIVGYQAYGTLGRTLVDGARYVKIFGEEIRVKAKIHTLGGLSAHAGQDQLMGWAKNFKTPRPRLFLIHGELDAMETLQKRLVMEQHWDAVIPSQGETVSI
jgi:metallo-beta-lactamase family protein